MLFSHTDTEMVYVDMEIEKLQHFIIIEKNLINFAFMNLWYLIIFNTFYLMSSLYYDPKRETAGSITVSWVLNNDRDIFD